MKERTLKITDFLALTVFAVFAVCLLLVLLTGARVYRNLVQTGQESYTDRTAAMYLTTRVRQSQTLTVEDFGGCQALTIREEIDGDTYLTRVYWHEGHLRELFSGENAELSPEDGEKVMEAESLNFSMEDGLLTAEVDGTRLNFRVRTGKETAP